MGLVILELHPIEAALAAADVEACVDDTLGGPEVAKEDDC